MSVQKEFLADTIVRLIKTGELARIINPIYIKDGQNFIGLYHAEIEGRKPGTIWALRHDEIELECPPKVEQ